MPNGSKKVEHAVWIIFLALPVVAAAAFVIWYVWFLPAPQPVHLP